MKTRKLYYFLVAVLTLSISITACSGDDGDMGPEGKQGIQGEVGPAGADGSVIYSGEGEPNAETGVAGDYYLDSTTGMIYGPKKNDDSWNEVDSFSLKGANGQDGQDGSKILSGYDTPSNSIGNIGDYYLDKETYTLYGPKLDVPTFGVSAWGTGLMLKGADGNANVHTFIATVASSDWYSWGSNVAGNFSKTLTRDINFSALNEDMYDNGIILVYWQSTNSRILLPETKLSSQKNFLTHEGYAFKNSSDGKYVLRIKKNLKGIENLTELLTTEDSEYRIKLITGQPATELSLIKNNPEKLFEVVARMEVAN
ncbi:hypothetical protein [Marinifilum flexuosum]|uniref:Collagen triple helix repeat protein n=1 Tax=Marinifilum flexuosum TaxID=1117708 RepID=A0A419X7C3_9BACT|nr:hypothetical protein [Marinifilum flexuosum]RKE03637.1 hypothetical protein BXY64_0646 [Marinifilum flexuosum]